MDLDRRGSRRSTEFADPWAAPSANGRLGERDPGATVYENFTPGDGRQWLAHLRTSAKPPTEEQFAVLEEPPLIFQNMFLQICVGNLL